MDCVEPTVAAKGMLLTNETLAKVTRSPLMGSQLLGNGLRPSPSPLKNQTHSSGTVRSTVEASRRGVIQLPQLQRTGQEDSVGASGGKGSRVSAKSRKRSRGNEEVEGSVDKIVAGGMQELNGNTNGSEVVAVSSEKVERNPKRRQRCPGSRRGEKKLSQQHAGSIHELVFSKSRIANSHSKAGALSILDIYGLKTRAVDVSKYMVEISTDNLLSGNFEQPQSFARGHDLKCNDIETSISQHLGTIMQLLRKPARQTSLLASGDLDNIPEADGKDAPPRVFFDLESTLQPEEEGTAKVVNKVHEDDKSVLPSNDISSSFLVDNLPAYSVQEFMSSLKLPPRDSLASLLAHARAGSGDQVGGAAENMSKNDSIPPLSFSFPPVGLVKAEMDHGKSVRNGKSFEKHWIRGGIKEGILWGYENEIKREKFVGFDSSKDGPNAGKECPGEKLPSASNGDGILCDNLRREVEARGSLFANEENCRKGSPQIGENDSEHRGQEIVEKKTAEPATIRENTLTSLQQRLEVNEICQSGEIPCSPGVKAAAMLLCDLANSLPELDLDKRKVIKKKRQRICQPSPTSKVSRLENSSQCSISFHPEETLSKHNPTKSADVPKVAASERRKSLSQVNNALSADQQLHSHVTLSNSSREPVAVLSSRNNNTFSKWEVEEQSEESPGFGNNFSELPKVSSKTHSRSTKDTQKLKQKSHSVSQFKLTANLPSTNCKAPKLLAKGEHVSRSHIDSLSPGSYTNSFSVKSYRKPFMAGESKHKVKQDLRMGKISRG